MKERTLKDLGLGGERKTHILEENFNIDELFNSVEEEKNAKDINDLKRDIQEKI